MICNWPNTKQTCGLNAPGRSVIVQLNRGFQPTQGT